MYYDSNTTGNTASKAQSCTGDDLSSMLGALSLFPANSSSGIIPPGSKWIIKEEGQGVPLESPLDIQEIAPQLWVSQTPQPVRAYHQNGVFQRPVVEDVAAVIRTWEECNKADLRKLAALIQKIINLIKECRGNAVPQVLQRVR